MISRPARARLHSTASLETARAWAEDALPCGSTVIYTLIYTKYSTVVEMTVIM